MMLVALAGVAAVLSEPYDSRDTAAVAAEQSCEQMSWHSGFEFGGVLLEREGKFYYTVAQTSHLPTHLDLHVSFTSEYKFAGIYHTHPGKDEIDRWFSTEDVRVADVFRVPSYIGIEYEHGDVRRYTPGATEVQCEPRNGLSLECYKIALGEKL